MTSPLPSRSFPEERRLASVLFADIIGFTTLAERLDFEDLTHLVREVWLKVDTIIEKHGGYVDKHIGDAVMAVWGAPFAGENDAEQAVMAGLALQEEMAEFSQTSNIPGAINLKMRVGINSGMVLAGYVGKRREYTVMGDTVNVCSRLQQLAEPETVIISENTHRLVRGAFVFHRVEHPMALRGKTEPIQAYLVTGVSAQPSRMRYHSFDSLETHMVGRDEEISRLKKLYQNAVEFDTPNLALVMGESGLGKSRLLMEFSNLVESTFPGSTMGAAAKSTSRQTPAVISVRALAQTSQSPFFLWKSLWMMRFGLEDIETLDLQRDKFLHEIQRICGHQKSTPTANEIAHMVGSLIGLIWPDSPYMAQYVGDPRGRLLRAFELTRELFRRLADQRPVMLVLDDLQFADQSSLDLIAYLIEPTPMPLPLFILGAARPDFTFRSPRWLNLASLVELKPLPILPETVSEAYPVLRALPVRALTRLAQLSDGNPYFMEEMVKSLLKSELVIEDTQTQPIIDQLQNQPPESLRVMLQARLDALSHEARAVALLASVVGRVFWVGAVLAAARVTDREGENLLQDAPSDVVKRLVQTALRQLVRAELAFPRANSSYSDDQEYIFKHSLLREVAYGLLPHRMLPRYHQAVAVWLESHERPEFLLMAADHYEHSGTFPASARCLESAAEQALLRGAVQEAEIMLQQARSLRDKPPLRDTDPLPLDQNKINRHLSTKGTRSDL